MPALDAPPCIWIFLNSLPQQGVEKHPAGLYCRAMQILVTRGCRDVQGAAALTFASPGRMVPPQMSTGRPRTGPAIQIHSGLGRSLVYG